MADPEGIRAASLTASGAFLTGFGGFTLAFAAAFDELAAIGFGLLLLLIAAAMIRRREHQRTPPHSSREPATTTDSGGWEAES